MSGTSSHRNGQYLNEQLSSWAAGEIWFLKQLSSVANAAFWGMLLLWRFTHIEWWWYQREPEDRTGLTDPWGQENTLGLG